MKMKVTVGLIETGNFGFRKKLFKTILSLGIVLLLHGLVFSQQISESVAILKFNEENLKTSFNKFITGIDATNLSKKYPEIAKKILSHQPRQQEIAVKMLAESQDIDSIPWILLLMNSEDNYVRLWSGYALKEIVSGIALERRDRDFPEFTVLKPLAKDAVDLKPMAWIVLKMLRSGDSNRIAYGMMMARYLNLYEFEELIGSHRDSQHPAVTNMMKWALKELELQKKYETGELKKEK